MAAQGRWPMSADDKRGDVPRCEVCDWPLAESAEKGCTPSNCSYRPREGTDEHRRIQERRRRLERDVREAAARGDVSRGECRKCGREDELCPHGLCISACIVVDPCRGRVISDEEPIIRQQVGDLLLWVKEPLRPDGSRVFKDFIEYARLQRMDIPPDEPPLCPRCDGSVHRFVDGGRTTFVCSSGCGFEMPDDPEATP